MQPPEFVPLGGVAAEIGLGLLGARLLQGGEPGRVPGENGVVGRRRGKQFAHQSDTPALLSQAEIGPGAFLVAVDQRDFGKELQVPRNTRLRLSENFGKIGNRKVAGGEQCKQTHARRFACRLQHVDQRIQSKRTTISHRLPHQHIKISLCDLRMMCK